MTKIWEKVKRPLEFLIWAGVLGFAFFRFGPQVTAAFGVGGGEEEFTFAAYTTLDGSVFSEKDLEGRVILVNAWATWCAPCVIEMPGFQRVYEDYKDQGFLVLGVSRDHEGVEKVRAFLKEKGISLLSRLPLYCNSLIPATLIFLKWVANWALSIRGMRRRRLILI